MGFDTLITIGIIIYIIYSVKKTFSSDRKEGGKVKKTDGWAGKLGDFINEVKEEIEKANQQTVAETKTETESTDPFWDNLREPEQEAPKAESIPVSQTLFYEPEPLPEPPAILEDLHEIPEPVEERESNRNYHRTHDIPMPLPVRGSNQSNNFKVKKSELKKAVIWSEIIAKPVGLRD